MLMDEIGKGASGDLTILTDEAIDDLIRQGKVAAGSRVDLARSAIGIAVRKGAPKPDIGTAEAFKRALLAAKAVCYSKTGISGIYFPTVMERLGIADEMKSKIVMPEPGVLVGTLVASGQAEIGVQQISELMPVPGIEVVGPLPAELQKMTSFPPACSPARRRRTPPRRWSRRSPRRPRGRSTPRRAWSRWDSRECG